MPKPTIQQIAAQAGVSTATVDRVLHGRVTVSKKTRDRVEAAVNELEFTDFPELILRAAQGALTFAFLIPRRQSDFVKKLESALSVAADAVDGIKVHILLERISLTDGADIIAALDRLDPAVVHGVGLFAIDAPGVNQAIGRAVNRGLKVITIVADSADSDRHHFVGIDNTAAGRVAGRLMGRFVGARTGTIGLICGSLRSRDQMDRYFGFRQIIESRHPNLTLLSVCEGESDPKQNEVFVRDLFAKHTDLRGIYSFAAGNNGILLALQLRPHGEKPVVIMHELTDVVRTSLSREEIDAVISQDTDHIARSGLRVLRALSQGTPIIPTQERIRIDIFLTDNIP